MSSLSDSYSKYVLLMDLSSLIRESGLFIVRTITFIENGSDCSNIDKCVKSDHGSVSSVSQPIMAHFNVSNNIKTNMLGIVMLMVTCPGNVLDSSN